MAETKGITCAVGSYTLLADGKTNVTVRLRTLGQGRLAIATSAPAAASDDYFSLSSNNPLELGNLTASDKVYFMPEGSDEVVEVIRG